MTEDLEILKIVCNKLEEAHIEYMLTGSMAANLYTTPRMTRDIDIVIEIFKRDINRFFSLFQNDFYVEKNDISEAIESGGMFNIIHNDTSIKIDWIIRENTPYGETKFERKNCINLGNSTIWVISPEDLIISKLLWAKDSYSEMQLKDVNNILQSQKNIRKDYILKWVNSLDLNEVYQRLSHA